MTGKRPDIDPEHGVAGRSGEQMDSKRVRAEVLSLLDMGRIYLSSDSFSDAIESLSAAACDESLSVLETEEVAEVYAGLARSHVGLGQYADARDWLERLDALDLDDARRAEGNVILAKIESRSGRFREALAASQKA